MGQQLSFSLLLGGPFEMKVLKKNKSEHSWASGQWELGEPKFMKGSLV